MSAIGLNAAGFNSAQLVGPLLGGLIIAALDPQRPADPLFGVGMVFAEIGFFPSATISSPHEKTAQPLGRATGFPFVAIGFHPPFFVHAQVSRAIVVFEYGGCVPPNMSRRSLAVSHANVACERFGPPKEINETESSLVVE